MASAKAKGLNFEINGKEIKIFGYQAEIPSPQEKTFKVMSCFGVFAQVKIPPPALPEIIAVIKQDEKGGKLKKIEYILLNATTAGFLMVQHVLTPAHFADAEEEDLFRSKYGNCIILKPVKLGKYTFPIIIVDGDDKKAYPAYATLDKEGQVV